MIEIAFIAGFIVGGITGWQQSRIKRLAKELQEQPKPEAGINKGEYGPINEYQVNQPDKETGLVMAKTPEQLEWEEQEQLRKAQHGVHS